MLLRISLIVALVAAACSEGLMLWTGRHNPSLILMVLFTGWVLSPFATFAYFRRSAAISWVMILTAPVAIAAYAFVALGPPRAQKAPFFLLVPLVLHLLLGIAAAISYFRNIAKA